MKIIALINQKGGVGKTTSVINIGAGLRKLGKTVLLVDLDPQSQLTYSLGVQAHELEVSVYEFLKGEATLSEVMMEIKELSLIPATLELSGAEVEFSTIVGREVLLRKAFKNLSGFDYVLLDCSPSLGILTLNALTTAQEVYIPLQTEFLALQGMSQLIRTIDLVKERLNPELEIAGIIGTRFDQRKNLNKEVIGKIKEYFGDKLFKTRIRENVSLAEAPSFGMTIFEYKPRSHGAKDYLKLSKEILKRSKENG